MVNIYNENGAVNKNQHIYDSYNDFVFANEKNIFNKLAMRIELYNKTKDLHGDIVECGVFKGAGVAVWAKLIQMNEPHSIKKVIGFDHFNPDFVEQLNGKDKEGMQQVFTRCSDSNRDVFSKNAVEKRLIESGIDKNKFELVSGAAETSIKKFVETRPGFRISLLYLDFDLDSPTHSALDALYQRVVPGGYIVFDEYAYHAWSEADAADRFFRQEQIHKINLASPTAYVVK